MSRIKNLSYSDSYVAERIHDVLAEGPEERPKLNLPKVSEPEYLRQHRLQAAPKQSAAHLKAKHARRNPDPPRPRRQQQDED
jgi:hypothetical protein